MDTKEHESFAHGVARREQEARAARDARIDETARAIFAATFAGSSSTLSISVMYPYDADGKGLAAECAAAYRFSLALERARDEAVKELDAPPLPSKEPR